MPLVHVYSSLGRFKSVAELRSFIDPTYSEDGDKIPSAFMREVDLEDFEPMCIEAEHFPEPKPLKQLLEGASYLEQWLPQLAADPVADAIVCIFAPNHPRRPQATSLGYWGALEYSP